MSILDLVSSILAKAGVPAERVAAFIAARAPDLADDVAVLQKPIDPILALTIVAELGDIGSGKIDGRNNPSNAA